ncbi:MAG: dihydroneopterin aldolase family protein [Candidatus Jordarchaeum sp.]|uniref:dihydroneopterin aldolase family protein n=1 Tax=Candidatus Jordarchaeum sp. TaxID=2823881 RepID=UPI00404AD053
MSEIEEFEAKAKRYFGKEVTDRDRAIFEGAITLGAVYHQFVGTPISKDAKVVSTLEKAIEKTMSLQPYIEKIEVKIDFNKIREASHPYDYSEVGGRNLSIRLVSKYGKSRVHMEMSYIQELDYPLMFIEKIEEED